ncbi:MAG: PKD domain-containing protein [Thermoplasmata archaeon]|nr:PKD domain-containing protein [Thermoplasmata archaeon]
MTPRPLRSTVVRPRPAGPSRRGALGVATIALAVVVLANLPGGSAAHTDACGFTVGVSATPATGTAPLEVKLNATPTSGTPSAYDWAFGDGSYWNSSAPGASDPLHRYAEPGSFDATVTVVEPACNATGNVTVITTPGPLVVTVAATPTSGSVPLTVTFSASISGGSGTYVSVFWAFGDGGVGSGVPVNYTYSHAGTFTARVNVTDSAGHWAVGSVPVPVRAPSTAAASVFGGWVVLAIAALAGAGIALVAVSLVARFGWGVRGPVPAGVDPGGSGRLPPNGVSSTPPASLSAERSGAPDGAPVAAGPASTEPVGPPSGRRGRAADAGRLQLTQRVILHIGSQGRLAPDDVGPNGLTQGGIAASLGIGQNSVTNVLRRLVAAGVLVHDVRHVSGQPRRLRVYRFTERGEAVYRDIWARSPGVRSGGPPNHDAAAGDSRPTGPDDSAPRP